MGDWFETIVDALVNEGEARALADAVVESLVEAGVVESEVTDCTLGAPGHAPGRGVLRYLNEPDEILLTLKTNGLEVVAERRPHVAADVERITCPRCGRVTTEVGFSWQEAVSEWYEGGPGDLVCESCNVASSVAAWQHDPPCGFGNLAFTFWNWPPFDSGRWRETPASLIEAVVGHPCVLVQGKI